MLIWLLAWGASLLLLVYSCRISKQKFPRPGLKVALILAEILLSLYFALRILFPLLPGPYPSGSQAVQVDKIFYTHQTAFPDLATQAGEREIPVHVYYPAGLASEEASTTHPLFIFSHGSFGLGTSNETLYRELASQGYIVMSLDHPHHAFWSTLSSGRKVWIDRNFFQEVVSSAGATDVEGTLESLQRWLAPRLEDLNLVLDRVLDDQPENLYEEKIDKDRIIVSGHSLGGSAALALGRTRREDIQALVILEAPFVADIVGISEGQYSFMDDPYPRPLLHIYSDALWTKLDSITTYGRNAQLQELADPRWQSKHLEGVGHLGLTDLALASPILTDLLDQGLNTRKAPETLQELNGLVLEFLQQLEDLDS